MIWNAVGLWPYYVPSSQPPVSPDAATVSLISINGHTANPNKKAVVDYLRDRQPDVIIVMEIDGQWAMALQELSDLYPHHLFEPRSDNFGIGLMSKRPFNERRIVEFGEQLPADFAAPVRSESHVSGGGRHRVLPSIQRLLGTRTAPRHRDYDVISE